MENYPFVSRISIRNTYSVTTAFLLVTITAASMLLYSCDLVNSSSDAGSGAVRVSGSCAAGPSLIITSPEHNVRKATQIVEVEVRDIQYLESSQGTSFAEITLKVEDRIVGISPTYIKIRRPFVTTDLEFLYSDCIPDYIIKERFIITLHENSDNEIYTTLGLYNGKFIIDNDLIRNTTITVEQFKQYIRDIRINKIEEFPDELPRMGE